MHKINSFQTLFSHIAYVAVITLLLESWEKHKSVSETLFVA